MPPTSKSSAASRVQATVSHDHGKIMVQEPVISVTEVNLARLPRALEGEVKGGSSLEGGCGVKVAVRGRLALLSHLSCL